MEKISNIFKVLFLTQTDIDGPASRYRVYQYLDYLRKQGVHCTVNPGIKKGDYFKIYGGFHPFRKFIALILMIFKRIMDLFRISRYDIIFLQREILPQSFPFIEKIISKLNKNMIFDFDDAIYLVPPQRNSLIYNLRYKNNIKDIIKCSKFVIAGNDHLKEYAFRFNPAVCVIPTAVDTDRFYVPKKNKDNNGTIIIGWMGTVHSIFYLKKIEDVFKRLNAKFKICLHVIGGGNFSIEGVNVVNKSWEMSREVDDLHGFDIGVAPLVDDAWGRGKCGLKALQYMSCGIPVVCSDAGVYKKMIVDGVNGFLAADNEEWIAKLSKLIQDEKSRNRISITARKMVEDEYSLKINAPKLKSALDLVVNK